MSNLSVEELERLLQKERTHNRQQRKELRSLNKRLQAEQSGNADLRLALRAIANGPDTHVGKRFANEVLYELPALRSLKKAVQFLVYSKKEISHENLMTHLKAVAKTVTTLAEEKILKEM